MGAALQPGSTAIGPPVIALVGPTAIGKTDLGIALARRCDAEIINADSRQVYRRLDIGSAKPTSAQQALVRHHLIDVVEPDEPFDCARFRQLALAAIDEITRRGKRVLVVGGTGLYVKALLYGLFEGPARDSALRAALERQEAAHPGSLHQQLATVDPVSAARLHPHDRVRLIRALEVFRLTGRPISAWQSEHAFGGGGFEALVLGLRVPRPALYARIDARCRAMVEAGLAGEIRQLYQSGFDPHLPALCSPGYREIGEFVRGLCDLDTAIERMVRATRRLAKRQLTWFRGDPHVVWSAPDIHELHARAGEFWRID